MTLFGKLFHVGFDAILITALLAGIKRNTGLTVALEQVPNKEFRKLIQNYLEVGEYTFDFVVVFLGVSLGCETDFGSENVAHRSQLHNGMNVLRQRSSSFKRLR
ncbi:hypothetical protein FFLO_01496 [Filobasidium floriforme]|uniref:DUF1748-domain-containing protein n=1 Tax=Filobasidium floriforme TaxID=5210 RepID=A0A8K0JPV1_9TREE|nr:hypothetical protein FFLO_01496 [Filobasidium floriforme]